MQEINCGIHANIDINVYHNSDGLSSTGVSLILDCPARYNYKYNVEPFTLTPKEIADNNKKYAKGKMAHTLVLEPHKFEALYYVMQEECDLRTKEGKIAWAAAEAYAHGREIIRASDIKDVVGMADSIKSTALFETLKNGCIEHSLAWQGGTYDTLLRARPDIYTDDLIIDLKTTSNILDFEYSIKKFGYHRQAAMQLDGLAKLTGKSRMFGFLVVEDKAPYLTKRISLPQDYLEIGRAKYLQAADIYYECKQSEEWPGYSDNFVEAQTPNYLKNEEI